MKKLLAAGIAGATLLVCGLPVFAGAKNATYIQWTWPAGIDKSAYFQTTGSGLVNAWTYNHPDLGDARFIFKPLSKFPNAVEEGCDEGWVRENPNWKPKGIYNSADSENKALIMEIFGTDMEKYIFSVHTQWNKFI